MKLKRCQQCGSKFEPRQIGQKCCTTACALLYIADHPELIAKVAKRQEGIAKRTRSRQKREKLKQMETVTDCLKRAQREVNWYVVHVRDRLHGCISCGTTKPDIKYDAGHFRTRKAAPHIRFHLDNIFKQCSTNCNVSLSGNILEMEKGMIERIGKERVEFIKNANWIHKWTKDEARAVEAEFKAINAAAKKELQ